MGQGWQREAFKELSDDYAFVVVALFSLARNERSGARRDF